MLSSANMTFLSAAARATIPEIRLQQHYQSFTLLRKVSLCHRAATLLMPITEHGRRLHKSTNSCSQTVSDIASLKVVGSVVSSKLQNYALI